MSSERTTHKISVLSCCLYFFSLMNVQLPLPNKRPHGTIVTLGETQKSWEEVDRLTQNKRLKGVLDVCETLKVPPSALAEPSRPPPALGPAET